MKQYLKLLMAREAKEVLGSHGQNLWLLTIVLVATFSSIAFSEGSMLYLRDKMEDPFTNWVNIKKDQIDFESFNKFRDLLALSENYEHYDYRDVLKGQYAGMTMQGASDTSRIEYLRVRFFEHVNTPLVKAILDPSNLVEGCRVDSTLLVDDTMGFIITLDAIKKLGYSHGSLPAYIHFLKEITQEKSYDINLDSLGLHILGDTRDKEAQKYVRMPFPVLAVVRRLPSNTDMMSACHFYAQYQSPLNPFDVVDHETDYLHSLSYWISEGTDLKAFEEIARQVAPDSIHVDTYNADEDLLTMKSWKPGSMLTIDVGDKQTPLEVFKAIDHAIESKWEAKDVCRVFQFITDKSEETNEIKYIDYISVEFRSLNHIREFEELAKNHGITLEMEQVHSKENFNAVTVMAGILSAAMVVFSIVCIIMFMVNMLQSYFQKVKRNIGTFKAFGMNGSELIQVYVIILVAIVFTGVVLALAITWAIQGLLPIIGIEKEGFNYLSLWNTTTYIATAVIFISTIVTVIWVMTRMLSQTPGDLIYDRN